MADYNFTCEKCGQECFVEFDYDTATVSNDGGNLNLHSNIPAKLRGKWAMKMSAGLNIQLQFMHKFMDTRLMQTKIKHGKSGR